MKPGTYRATPNNINSGAELSPAEEKSQQQINNENNQAFLQNAAQVASNIPVANVYAKAFLAADKLTGGKVSQIGGKALTKINNTSPGGKQAQKSINKIQESGIGDKIGKVASVMNGETGKAGAASKAGNEASKGVSSQKKSKHKNNKSSSNNTKKPSIFLLLLCFSGCGIFLFTLLFIILELNQIVGMLDLTSGSTSNAVTSSNNVQYTVDEVEKYLIYVGDSRTVGMQSAISNTSIGYIAEGGAGYDYLTTTATNSFDTSFIDKKFAVFAFGVNDLSNINKYITYYEELIDRYPEITFYFMSVNPVDENNSSYSIKNSDIESFNSKLSNEFGDKYIDVYNEIKTSFFAQDGLHYDSETYAQIHSIVIQYIADNNYHNISTTSEYGYPSYSESEELNTGETLEELIGQSGIEDLEKRIKSNVGSGCTGQAVAGAAIALIDGLYSYGYHLPYYWGGGHGTYILVDGTWGKNMGCSLSDGNICYYYNSFDCSGFVSWAMQSANVDYLSGSDGYKDNQYTDVESMEVAKPGDVLVSSEHIILIIENTGSELITAESTNPGGVQYNKESYSYYKDKSYEAYDTTKLINAYCKG